MKNAQNGPGENGLSVLRRSGEGAASLGHVVLGFSLPSGPWAVGGLSFDRSYDKRTVRLKAGWVQAPRPVPSPGAV